MSLRFYLGVVALAVLMLVPLSPGPDRLVSALFNAAHFIALAAFTLIVLPRGRLDRVAVLRTAAWIVVVMVLLEVLQPLVGRRAEFEDVVVGFAGMLAGLRLGSLRDIRRPVHRVAAWCVAVLLAAASLSPVAGVLIDRGRASSEFPMLSSLESSLEKGRWDTRGCRIARSRDHATHGEHALEVRLTGRISYPGVTLRSAHRDWSHAGGLALDVTSGKGSRRFWIRVDDCEGSVYADRFQKVFDVGPGTHRLSIACDSLVTPAGRRLNMTNIVSATVFLESAQPGERFWIDRVALEMRTR